MKKILVVAPMERECDNMLAALSSYPHENEYDVICSGVGKARGAASVAVALSKKQYDAVAVIGYAGAASAFEQGDVIAPHSVLYHDVVCPEYIELDFKDTYPLLGTTDCLLLSGDSFIEQPHAVRLIEKHGKKVAFDMEAGGCAQIAAAAGVPCIVIKLVSDITDRTDNAVSFMEFSHAHTDFTPFVEILEKI